MPEFILEVPQYKQSDGSPKIRISKEAYTVLTQMCAKTAMPMSKVASQAVLFAAQYLTSRENEKEGQE